MQISVVLFWREAYKLAKTRDADSAEMLSTVKYLVQSHLNRSYEFWDLREPDSDVVARDRAIGVLQLALAAPNLMLLGVRKTDFTCLIE